jgi:hypothetical protein
MSLAHSDHRLARRPPGAQQLLPSLGQRRCCRWGARAPAQPFSASAALRHHLPASLTTLHQPATPAALAARCAPRSATSAGGLDSRPRRIDCKPATPCKGARLLTCRAAPAGLRAAAASSGAQPEEEAAPSQPKGRSNKELLQRAQSQRLVDA